MNAEPLSDECQKIISKILNDPNGAVSIDSLRRWLLKAMATIDQCTKERDELHTKNAKWANMAQDYHKENEKLKEDLLTQDIKLMNEIEKTKELKAKVESLEKELEK